MVDFVCAVGFVGLDQEAAVEDGLVVWIVLAPLDARLMGDCDVRILHILSDVHQHKFIHRLVGALKDSFVFHNDSSSFNFTVTYAAIVEFQVLVRHSANVSAVIVAIDDAIDASIGKCVPGKAELSRK